MWLTNLISVFGDQICSLVNFAAQHISCGCRTYFYQPEEPAGFAAFADSREDK